MGDMETKECVGCGFCCIKAPCVAALRLYPGATICPQLIWDEEKNRYICGLMTLPGNLGLEYQKELAAGAGCCMNLNDWRKDIKKRTPDKQGTLYNPLSPVFQAFLKCYASEPFMNTTVTELVLFKFKEELKNLEYEDEDINHIVKNVKYAIAGNRNDFARDFMG